MCGVHPRFYRIATSLSAGMSLGIGTLSSFTRTSLSGGKSNNYLSFSPSAYGDFVNISCTYEGWMNPVIFRAVDFIYPE